MPHAKDQKPGIFWTWQDAQIEDEALVRESIADIGAHGFGTLLVQPRGCRYPMVGEPFVRAAAHASQVAREHGLAFWLHLDPRSMSRHLMDAAGEAAEYLIVAGTGDPPEASLARRRALDAEAAIAPGGTFCVRLEYPKTRPYHVHSEGALSFRPLRLERCLVYRRDAYGIVVASTVEDVTASTQLFVNHLRGYVEVFGAAGNRPGDGWFALAFVAFGSNYPDFAGTATRAELRAVLDRFVASGVILDGLWWDEPGYCTGFDRSFAADRGRLPWGPRLAELHQQRTGRDAADDLLYLVAETDDGRWGERREAYYRTIEAAVFGAQSDLLEHARAVVGEHLGMGVHHTWHQNADDVIHGSMDWWRGSAITGAGYADVGDAERVDDPEQMAEVTALGAIAASLGRHSASRTAYYNLWGVRYGAEGAVPGPDVVTWWADLQATLGCNWLAHTYGPTGYFERPSVWGPGYPDHPTWPRVAEATDHLRRALSLSEGAVPECDVALVYPLGTMYRLGADIANPLARGTHVLIDALVRAGFELDIVSAEALRRTSVQRYRAVVYLHPFGAAPEDVDDLGARARAGARVVAAGLPAVAGAGYADAGRWQDRLGIAVPESSVQDLFGGGGREPAAAELPRTYRGVPVWGRAAWPSSAPGVGELPGRASYLGLLLEGFGAHAPDALSRLGIAPRWRLPEGAVATRTRLPGGAILVKLCPARFGRPFEGTLQMDGTRVAFENGAGLTCLRTDPEGNVHGAIVPAGVRWTVQDQERAP